MSLEAIILAVAGAGIGLLVNDMRSTLRHIADKLEDHSVRLTRAETHIETIRDNCDGCGPSEDHR